MSKKPINVYWSPSYLAQLQQDRSFLYPTPKTLFSETKSKKVDDLNNSNYLTCPAISSKFKKILVMKNNINCSYEYSHTDKEKSIKPKTKQFINAEFIREPTITSGPNVAFELEYIFFADEPLEVYLTPPMFSKPEYTNYGSVMPGQFDIGQWFRPLIFEVQMWKNSGEFYLKQDEPIMYLEFLTDRPILLHRFNMNEKLFSYGKQSQFSREIFGRFQTLQNKYLHFNKAGLGKKIITEIKKNLIEEETYKF